jgi:hypothetical protein
MTFRLVAWHLNQLHYSMRPPPPPPDSQGCHNQTAQKRGRPHGMSL